jgi:isopentenyl-diphosphate delta-isomerase type 1
MNKDPIWEYVDDDDNVVGCLPRSEVRAQKKSYRLVEVFVFNKDGQLLVQKRSETMKRFPGYFGASAGGHVDPGETYEEAAVREMKEELGIDEHLEFVKKDKITYEGVTKFITLFKCVTDKELKLDSSEVKSVRFMDISQIKNMIKTEKFLPVFIKFFNEICDNNNEY